MSPEIDLRVRLDDELDRLPSVPAEAYLAHGRRARRRRRAVAVAVAASAAVVVTVATAQVAGGGRAADRSDSLAGRPTSTADAAPTLGPDPDFVAPEPNNPVEAQDGLDGVDWFTTADVPAWAKEHGRHGPVDVRPDGRLWVAPDATVRRVVVDPYTPGEHGIAASYAVEATCTCLPEEVEDGIAWVILTTDGTEHGGGGTMEAPGWTTDDFELWVDGATARVQGRPTIAERFAHFADDSTGRMVAGAPGVTLVRQQADADLGSGRVRHTRAGAAEVTYAGQTFYVLGVDPEQGRPWYLYWTGDTQPDFDAFLVMLRGNW